jgi:hypothetical protein
MDMGVQGIFSDTLLAIVPSTDILRPGTHPRYATSINLLSGDVLVEIFDFYQKHRVSQYAAIPEVVWDWHILVHVCLRWRQVVFSSPLRLNLRILCTHGTPVRKNLDIWPTLPIHLDYSQSPYKATEDDTDNIIAALEHPDRVIFVAISLASDPQLGKITMVIQQPFPVLRHLLLWKNDSYGVPVLPREFLGRSAPCLQTFQLLGIPFPALPRLLLSTSDLVTLNLFNIPNRGYISPEAMAMALATLTRLRTLTIEFESRASRSDRIPLPPATRIVLPTLTSLGIYVFREYLEDFVARINAPRLHGIEIRCFNQLVEFEVPQLWQFIDHSERLSPCLSQAMRCILEFDFDIVHFTAGPTTHIHESESGHAFPWNIAVRIRCEGTDWQVSHIAQAFNQISATGVLSNMVHLEIDPYSCSAISPEPGDMDDIEWLQLLSPFSSVQTLFVSRQIAGHISRSLDDIPEAMTTEVFPALDMLCLEDQPVSSVQKFITARSESGRPVTTVDSRREYEERQTSYLNQYDGGTC